MQPLGAAVNDLGQLTNRYVGTWTDPRLCCSSYARSKKDDRGTSPYLFLGPASYVTHTGDRPIAVTWKLATPMPTDFFNYASAIAQ